ncbi:peroxiredoxin [Lentiprolixibacter aurantiacus]|uniref:thioredoxin-dependent peroxiredoxin n=1 Tax=Lentiprolixibacter aurantiacus TaxID=2993939 RepID=A0AAE3SQ62_9FLAO|nr:peroxiredoxin [Lentiprolixibacter aurantiacus]MCX2720182.1 peroxiredoxin [Lentiprolixibacter aurantiacus]
MGLKVGDKVPHFTLNDQDGNLFNISDHLGKHNLVVFFYPKDNTPGCTMEVCSFRDSYEEFTELGAMVIGISADSENSHRKFASKYRLPFTLLADRQNKVRKLFKVEGKMFNLLPGRETYVVDKSGKISMVFNSINATQHMKKALNALKQQN